MSARGVEAEAIHDTLVDHSSDHDWVDEVGAKVSAALTAVLGGGDDE